MNSESYLNDYGRHERAYMLRDMLPLDMYDYLIFIITIIGKYEIIPFLRI